MTPTQIQLVQIARRQLGLDEADYRQVLQEVGGAKSCKDLTNESLEDVMAHLEHRGFRMTGQPADYWRQKKLRRGIFADARQVHLIERLARDSRYCLPALCERFSDGRAQTPGQLTPREAYELTEMLKSSAARERVHERSH